MASILPDDTLSAIARLLGEGVDKTAIARRLGIGRGTVIRWSKILAKELSQGKGEAPESTGAEGSPEPQPAADAGQPTPAEGVQSFEESGDTAKVTCVVAADGVATEEDLIRVCKIDLTRWRIASMKVKAYQGQMKLETRWTTATRDKAGASESKPCITQMFSVSATLERVLPKHYIDATDALFARLESKAPRLALPPLPPPSESPYLMAMNLFDAHFGKLCWAPETGENYDLRIADRVYRNAVEDLLRLTSGFPVGRVVFVVGNDLHHVDTLSKTTTGGTPQDADGRYFKMVDVVEDAVLWAIERIIERSCIDVIYIGGNHDRIASWHLCKTIKAYFRNHQDRVTVDVSPMVRKYRKYGTNLFGFAHGHQCRDQRSLVSRMALEAKQEWAETTCREWFFGHWHTSKSVVTQQSNEIDGVRLNWGPSTAGTDAWHFENGFSGNLKAAEAFLYSMESGRVGQFLAPARYAA